MYELLNMKRKFNEVNYIDNQFIIIKERIKQFKILRS